MEILFPEIRSRSASPEVFAQDGEFTAEKVEREVGIHWEVSQSSTELVQHQARRDHGTVDGTAVGAGASLGLSLREEGGGIVLPGVFVGGGEDPHHFSQHPAVAPVCGVTFRGAPDGGAGSDRIDTAEDDLPDMVPGAIPVGNRLDLQLRIHLP